MPPQLPLTATPFSHLRYRFTTGLRSGETAAIRDERDQILLTYRAFASILGVVAALVAGIVCVVGVAATWFLIEEHSPLRALIALALTFAFAFLITRLVPRSNVTLYDGSNPALTISQRSARSYAVAAPNGTLLGHLHKSPFSFLGRARWTVMHEGRVLAEAIEESFGRAIVRKVFGKFSRRFETNLFLRLPGIEMGRIVRRATPMETLELTGDALDRRVAVALATVILGREP